MTAIAVFSLREVFIAVEIMPLLPSLTTFHIEDIIQIRSKAGVRVVDED